MEIKGSAIRSEDLLDSRSNYIASGKPSASDNNTDLDATTCGEMEFKLPILHHSLAGTWIQSDPQVETLSHQRRVGDEV